MPRRRELPWSTVPSDTTEAVEPPGRPMRPLAVANEYQALMEAAPHAPLDWTAEQLLPLRDVLADAIDTILDERERWIFERLIIERRSIRAVAADLCLSKSYVHRIRQEAEAKLREHLAEHTLIVAYLSRHERNEEADDSNYLGVRRQAGGAADPDELREAA